jgi:hypothetical protein
MPPAAEFCGNSVALRFLERLLVREQLPATMLLTGPGGVGKALAAWRFVKSLVCAENRKEGAVRKLEPCGQCANCRALEAGASSDFVGVRPKTSELTVKQVREDHDGFRDAYLYPSVLPYRFFLLEECHALSEELSNMMLKLLEEPPERTLFILVTDRPSLLLPTIASRSLEVRFLAESEDELAQWLQEQGVGETAARNAALFAQGRPGLAQVLLSDADLLPKVASVMGRIAGAVRKEFTAASLYPAGEALLALAELVHKTLLRVEEGDVPRGFYLLPWRRPAQTPDGEEVPVAGERERELGRDALQLVLDFLKVTLWRVEREGGPPLASRSTDLFLDARGMLDVNLRPEQVVDYLLINMGGVRIKEPVRRGAGF